MEKRHAIILIKNSKGEYLQYYDERWSSYLFLNCKILDSDDLESIRCEVKNRLGVSDIDISYLFDKIHTKFSESDKIYKEYHHYFYLVNVNCDLSLDDNMFKWYSYDELLKDERIQKVNSDIVNFIKGV